MTRRAAVLVACAAALAGCRNPFWPRAELRIDRFFPPRGDLAYLVNRLAGQEPHATTPPAMRVSVQNWSTVPVQLTSYSVVYRQVGAQTNVTPVRAPGEPIDLLGGASGLRWPIRAHLAALRGNATNYLVTDVWVRPFSIEFYNYISTHADSADGGLDLDFTFYGTDHNGYDVTVAGTMHVEIY